MPWSSSWATRRRTSRAPCSRSTPATRRRPPARSETDPACLDALVGSLVEPNERVALRVGEVDGVGGGRGIVALAHEFGLRVFERGGHFDLAPDAQEERARVVGQALEQARPEAGELQSLVRAEAR